jgi:hypothetical protein
MEDAQGSYNHEDEVKGMNISLAKEETKLNGHRGGIMDSMDLEGTMKIL